MLGRWILILAGFVFLAAMAQAVDDRNPFAGDAKAAKAGEYEFRINCALCHGLRRARRRPRAGFDPRAEEAHALRRGDVSSHQQRHCGHRDARERHQRPRRRHDRRRDLADHHLHSQPGSESAGQQPQAARATAKICFMATRIARCATWSKAKAGGWART